MHGHIGVAATVASMSVLKVYKCCFHIFLEYLILVTLMWLRYLKCSKLGAIKHQNLNFLNHLFPCSMEFLSGGMWDWGVLWDLQV